MYSSWRHTYITLHAPSLPETLHQGTRAETLSPLLPLLLPRLLLLLLLLPAAAPSSSRQSWAAGPRSWWATPLCVHKKIYFREDMLVQDDSQL